MNQQQRVIAVLIALVAFVLFLSIAGIPGLIIAAVAILGIYKNSPEFRSWVTNTFFAPTQTNSITSSLSTPSFSMDTARVRKTGLAITGTLLAVIILWNMIVIVPAGYTGVYHLFGKVRDQEMHSGFHLVNPLASIELMSIRTEQYTMTISHEEGGGIGVGDSIDTLTKEGLKVTLDMTILYHLNEESASDVYRTLGVDYQEKIIRPEARSAIREVVSQYEAKDIYSDKRDEVVKKIEEKMHSAMDPRGITLEAVLVRNVVLPPMLTQAIEAKLTAEQEAIKYDFLLQREKKEADRKRIEAEGQRDAQRLIDQSLSKEYLQYLYIKELKDRQGTIYVPVDMPLLRGI